jgi:3-oxoacyl-(acyl-carrier-protein) synthase
MKPIAVTGMGIISAIGSGIDETLHALLEARSGVGQMHILSTRHTDLPVGEVPLTDDALKAALHIPVEERYARTALLGIYALREALSTVDTRHKKVALINGTTVGGMDLTERHYPDSSYDYSLHSCGAVTNQMARYFGSTFSYVTTTSTACSSAANAIATGTRLLEAGLVDIAVVGGSECLTRYHLNGFNALRILDSKPCRPFDENRAGLSLGEGAAFLVLQRNSDHPISMLEGYGNACDAYHQTATSPEGRGLQTAMRTALDMSGLKSTDIDYINAHGTGTPDNDAAEECAMRAVFASGVPPFSSTKAMTGHTTSASGAIEAVLSILAMNSDFLPPTLRFRQPISGLGLSPITQPTHSSLQHVMTNSSAFGGNCTSLIFGKPTEHVVDKSSQNPSAGVCKKVYLRAKVILDEHEEPDYRSYIPMMQLRRMSPILRRAMVAALRCMEESGIACPDAILTATHWGCLNDTERFLDELSETDEELLSPSAFIQSVHNTVAAQMAIRLKCGGFNCTYTHCEQSLSSALLEAFLLLRSGKIENALVTNNDEHDTFGLCESNTAEAYLLTTREEGSLEEFKITESLC